MVEQWFPKPKVMGSTPLFPDFIIYKTFNIVYNIISFLFQAKKITKQKKKYKK